MIKVSECIGRELALKLEVGSSVLVFDAGQYVGQVALVGAYDVFAQQVTLQTPSVAPTSSETMPLETFLERTQYPADLAGVELLGPSYGARFGSDGMLIQPSQEAA